MRSQQAFVINSRLTAPISRLNLTFEKLFTSTPTYSVILHQVYVLFSSKNSNKKIESYYREDKNIKYCTEGSLGLAFVLRFLRILPTVQIVDRADLSLSSSSLTGHVHTQRKPGEESPGTGRGMGTQAA